MKRELTEVEKYENKMNKVFGISEQEDGEATSADQIFNWIWHTPNNRQYILDMVHDAFLDNEYDVIQQSMLMDYLPDQDWSIDEAIDGSVFIMKEIGVFDPPDFSELIVAISDRLDMYPDEIRNNIPEKDEYDFYDYWGSYVSDYVQQQNIIDEYIIEGAMSQYHGFKLGDVVSMIEPWFDHETEYTISLIKDELKKFIEEYLEMLRGHAFDDNLLVLAADWFLDPVDTVFKLAYNLEISDIFMDKFERFDRFIEEEIRPLSEIDYWVEYYIQQSF